MYGCIWGVVRVTGYSTKQEIRDKIFIPLEMQPAIDNLTGLFIKAQLDIPLGEVSRAKFNEQMALFDEAVKLPEEALLHKFVSEGASHLQDLERQHVYQEILRDMPYNHDEQVPVSGNVRGDDCCVLS